MTASHRSSEALARDLVQQIRGARDERGSLSVDDLTGVVHGLLQSIQTDVARTDMRLHQELQEIADHIHKARADMAGAIPHAMSSEKLSSASNELGAVLEVTEEAANIIMDAADEIQRAISNAAVDSYLESKIGTAVTRIYEACNFQDLAGQRVNKVIRLLGDIETRITRLVGLLSGDPSALPAPPEEVPVSFEQSLMNGPQLTPDAPNQADIDALFGDIK